jgi:hypothetical protein
MNDFQLRVIKEKDELDVKINALCSFMVKDIFESLKLEEQFRLKKQFEIMKLYSAILGERIAHFS